MELKYLDEYIKNENGIKCHVLDVDSLDFNHAMDAIKDTETLVLKAKDKENINTIVNGLIETSYITSEGDAIFINSLEDRYVPYDNNGVPFKFDNLALYGYKITSDVFNYDGYQAVKIKNTNINKVLYEVIKEPTVIKNNFGNNHQFLFPGASLLKSVNSNKIKGVAKIAFDNTYKILNKIIITSGKKYIDIDGYSAIFAYKKLLESMGMEVYAVSSSPLNESVSPIIEDMGYEFDKVDDYSNAKFIILDVSNPEFFDECVREEDIIFVIDHHVGYSDYWNSKNVKCDIDFIGSVCTTIFEYIKTNKKEEILDESLCKLLMAGILDNTIALKSSNTTKRDIDAYNELRVLGKIDDSWDRDYFESCYKDIDKNLESYLINDIKVENISPLIPKVMGQLITLDIDTIINNMDVVNKVFSKYDEWMLNIISISSGHSYLITSDAIIQKKLSKLFNGKCEANYVVIDKCILRKEIIKIAKEKSNN